MGCSILIFFNLVVPPFCVSNHLNALHLSLLGCISVVYPLLLICLTWMCVELHGRNFRPLVWLWRPFHRCFVRLRRGWNTKSDITDVFTTFFILSYCKCTYLALLLYSGQAIRNLDASGELTVYPRASVDLSIPYGSRHYLLFEIPSAILFIVYNILPPLLLILYPCKTFRRCLSKCRLNFVAVNIFFEKLSGCYRNGLDGGRDMRSFSGLYFFLRKRVLHRIPVLQDNKG